MTEKNGTIKQCRATRFAKRPASSISSCPFKGAEVAIVPVRYALDRSRHDPAPDRLKPFKIMGSERTLGGISVKPSDLALTEDFLDHGAFKAPSVMGKTSSKRPEPLGTSLCFPQLIPDETDIVWQTWVPLTTAVDFMEIQLRYPPSLGESLQSALFSFKLDLSTDDTPASPSTSALLINNSHHLQFSRLELI
jgi:hypothetical protein